MNKRYRLCDVEEAVSEMEELMDIACVWDEGERLFMPDFDVTVVYEGNIETQDWLYYEQDGMVVTLGNWLNGRLSCEQIEQLWCELVIPETNNTDNESEE